MAIKNLFIIIGITITLSACNNSNIQNAGKFELSNQFNFSIHSPVQFIDKYVRENGSIAYSNFKGSKTKYDAQDILVIIDSDISNSKTHYYSCDSNSIIDSLIIENSKTTHTIKGKIPDPPCEVDVCDFTKYGYTQFKGRYVLCSEHEDKTIRVEVNQITDNPQLAEEIFSTFRWTK